ncbi:heme exporter protein CcmB [Salmonella enterica subsp. enterica]|nr:heme exporter protein CcmB [Salmonella enterica subsp. enterica]
MVITLFPLSVGPQPQLLARIAPGIASGGGAAGLAAGAGAAVSRRPGTAGQLMLLPVPLPAVVLAAKVLAHWAVTGLPLIMLSPAGGAAAGMDVYGWKIMALKPAALLGTPALGNAAPGGVGLRRRAAARQRPAGAFWCCR